MLITNDFVMLNLPKTGSSFARAVIKEIFEQRQLKGRDQLEALQQHGDTGSQTYRELILPNIKVTGVEKPADQHGAFSQIPKNYLNRTIVSIVRNPYSRFMSLYDFRAWQRYPLIPKSLLKESFPSYPTLSVDDFVRLQELQVIHGRLHGKIPDAHVGSQTIQFIQMFFKNPDQVLINLTDEYLDSEQVFDDMADIQFLRQEYLNEDLADFLEQNDYSTEEIQYVRRRNRVNVTKRRFSERSSLWTKSAIAYVQHKERMICRILESNGVLYSAPKIHFEC